MAYLVAGFLIYLAYRFITGFILPVYKAATTVKKQFNSMKTQMEEQPFMNNIEENQIHPIDEKPKYDPGGEYIPFEEIKNR